MVSLSVILKVWAGEEKPDLTARQISQQIRETPLTVERGLRNVCKTERGTLHVIHFTARGNDIIRKIASHHGNLLCQGLQEAWLAFAAGNRHSGNQRVKIAGKKKVLEGTA